MRLDLVCRTDIPKRSSKSCMAMQQSAYGHTMIALQQQTKLEHTAMAVYRVEYRIDIEADTPEQAAQIAQECCLEWDARIWTVIAESGEERDIELNDAGDVLID